MDIQLTRAQKAARTRKLREQHLTTRQKAELNEKRVQAARKAVMTKERKRAIMADQATDKPRREPSESARAAFAKAHASEAASKEALRALCDQKGWKLAFFEGKTGAPRNGIIDAVAFRLKRGSPDLLDLRLIQLKGGKAGASGVEIGRLKKAVAAAEVRLLLAVYDGETIHQLSEEDPATKI